MNGFRQRCMFFILVLLVASVHVPEAVAVTAAEIVASLTDNLDNVSDYTASVDIDYDHVGMTDMTDGSLQWKRSGGNWKSKMVVGTGYSGDLITDGVGWNFHDRDDVLTWANLANGGPWVRDSFGTDMFNMENILDDETWTKATGTETVNSVDCYKVYTTKSDSNYEVWADTATMDKVIRTKATDESDDLQWQLDYSSYSNVEGSAQLAATIVTKLYEDEDLKLTTTYDFSSVDIDEGLSDSIFAIESP